MRQTRTSKKRERDLTRSNPISIDLSSDDDAQLIEMDLSTKDTPKTLPDTLPGKNGQNIEVKSKNDMRSSNKFGLKKAAPAFNIAAVEDKKSKRGKGSTQVNKRDELDTIPYDEAEETFFASSSGLEGPLVSMETRSSKSSSLLSNSDSGAGPNRDLNEDTDGSGAEDLSIVDVYEIPDSKKFLRQRKGTKRKRHEEFENNAKESKKEKKKKSSSASRKPSNTRSAKNERAGLATRRSKRNQSTKEVQEDSDLEILEPAHGASGMPVVIAV